MKKYNNLFLLTIVGICFIFYASKATSQENIKSIELFSAGFSGITEYRIPSLLSTPNGTLIALVDARVDRRGDIPNNVDLAIRRSTDNGETWGDVQIIADYGKPEGYEVFWGAARAIAFKDSGRVL